MSNTKNQNIIQTVTDYGKKLFGFIRGKVSTDEDAEDILQEVWYQYANASAINTIEQLSGWLYAVAKNKITDKYRKQKTSLLEDFGYEDEDGELHFKDLLFSSNQTPEDEFFSSLVWEELFTALEELPEKQRQVFEWNELEDMTLQEIADKTGENLKTIISRKRYAIAHIRKKLQYLYDDLID